MTCTRCKKDIDPKRETYLRTKRGPCCVVCPPQPSEAQIQQACTQLLELDGWRALRTDPCSDKERGKGFGEVGMADALFIRYLAKAAIQYPGGYAILKPPAAEVLWVEFKKLKGKPTAKQLDWHAAERARGALTVIAGYTCPATIEGFWEWYAESGLKRKDIKVK